MSSKWWADNSNETDGQGWRGRQRIGGIPVIRMRGWSGDGGVLRVLGAMALVLWGVSTGLSGLGLGHSAAAALLNTWWPAPFMVYALVGIALGRLPGFGAHTGLFLGVLVVSGVLLLSHLALSGVNVGTLVWAAILVVLGLLVLRPDRRWW